jgi:hypothetical protein
MTLIPQPNIVLELNTNPIPIRGDDGLSAYDAAVENGFVGTEQEWLASFVDRANHIGTQPINTIQNLQNSLNSKINTTAIGVSVQPYDEQTVTYTQSEKDKLGTIAEGAEVNVNANWSAVSGDAQILNKPVLSTVATTGTYSDLSGRPTLGTASATNITDYATSAQGTKADTALQPASIINFETTTQLNSRDTANRARGNHTGTQPISSINNLQTSLDSKEPTITIGTTGQYWRGDKTFQTLDKSAVGLIDVNYPSGQFVTPAIAASSLTSLAHDADLYRFFPFTPTGNLRASSQVINVTTASANDEVTLFLFSLDPTTGLLLDQIFHTNPLSCSTTGLKSATEANFKTSSGFETRQLSTFVFEQNTKYWIGYWSSGTGAVRANPLGNLTPLGLNSSTSNTYATNYWADGPLDINLSNPVTLSLNLSSSALPNVRYTTI